MTTFSHFDLETVVAGKSKHRVAVIFTAEARVKSKSAAEELKLLFAEGFTPKRTVLIGMMDALEDLKKLLQSDDLKHAHLPFEPRDVELYVFCENGRLVKNGDLNQPMNSNESSAIRRQGMSAIFGRRGGEMKAGGSYHYVKPSGGHSRVFLRPGNIMQNGSEVAFLSAWLLPCITKYTPAIYCDTASITQVAYSLVSLARRLGICDLDTTIQSFGSYDGMENTEKFSPEHEALVLISASTSGNLRKRAIDAGASPKCVIALYSMAEGEDCLCDLRYDSIKNPHGVSPFKTYKKANCPECAGGSLPISIAGDSFLPETPEPQLRVLKRTDKPKWLDAVLNVFEGKKIVRCFKPLSEGKNAPFYLDLSNLCELGDENEIFQLPLSRIVSVGLDVIIHLPDNASKMLAVYAQSLFGNQGIARPEILDSVGNLDAKLAAFPGAAGKKLSVLVVSSCVGGGFSLLAVSRSLRNVANRISYFIGIAMSPSQQAWSEFKSNLDLRNDDHGRNPIESVWTALMPRFGFGELYSWMAESRWLEEREITFPQGSILQKRLSILRNLSGERNEGLVEDAFLPSASGRLLALAQNFAFYKSKSLTQAEIFFVVTAILHALRDPTHPAGLRQSLNSPVLLSPSNFDRYNDSVLQAALVRAAHPSELAYASHPAASRMMSDLIARMASHVESAEGEALPEFLLALVTRRMTLCEGDLDRLINCYSSIFEKIDYLKPFGDSLKDIYRNLL